MTKTLQLQFMTEAGKTSTLSLDQPKEPLDPAIVKQSMEAILDSQAFNSANGALVSIKGASLIDRTVTDISLN
ncbi:DUF2922 domain-containing protein [Bacillus xiapuensis]|uniref:DUF2922 domain-containing protein n=1 Tax=Bacillus xiapuensis TaxID=2014075 RepID=UPI000C2503E0|nr:DUF2922 domain-containing protein [Bacillus xiapuensis]